ncbi:hypothetical protein LWI29_024148 [Acer saccharum]|uniref:Uncharacterized protein n=1 Tax=Acer saccharum TaxID=4024 RepID=A0AA39VJB6_ACESA|nr:hypothetical protein LWI29_024148 [Acer saccharum]
MESLTSYIESMGFPKTGVKMLERQEANPSDQFSDSEGFTDMNQGQEQYEDSNISFENSKFARPLPIPWYGQLACAAVLEAMALWRNVRHGPHLRWASTRWYEQRLQHWATTRHGPRLRLILGRRYGPQNGIKAQCLTSLTRPSLTTCKGSGPNYRK